MFGKSDHRKKGNTLSLIPRIFLSLIIMAILGIGLLQAVRSFSGYDPLKVSPKATLKSLMTSEGAYNFLTSLLSFNPAKDLSLDKAKQVLSDDPQGSPADSSKPASPLLYRFALVADSHIDYDNLAKALKQAKDANVKFIVGIGDLSDVGTVAELKKTKEQYDLIGLPYYMTPGDHDLWDSRNRNLTPTQDFKDVFGVSYQSFTYENTRFIMVYNSDNYLGLDGVELQWIDDELQKIEDNPPQLSFVVTDIPLFHPSSDHVMGKTNDKLKAQADHLTSIFKKHGIAEVFAGDTHFYTRYKEPTNDLWMTSVGAVTADRNPQSPRFALVDVFEDGSYNVQDTEIQ